MYEDIKRKIEDHEKRITRLEEQIESKPEIIMKEISIREFLIKKKPKGDVQKTLAIGHYLETHENMSCFNVADLRRGFRQAKEIVPKNLGDKVYKNIKKGHMMEAEEDKDGSAAWELTSSGIEFVENDFKKK